MDALTIATIIGALIGALGAIIAALIKRHSGKTDSNNKSIASPASNKNLAPSSIPTSSLNRLAGTIDLSSIGDVEKPVAVFYAKRFKSPPCLNLKLVYARGNLEIIEQRPDGFKFMVSWKPPSGIPPGPRGPGVGVWEPRDPAVKWVAEGEFQE